jgi:hypothetical protein
VDALERQAGLGQPLRELRYGCGVVVVEVAAGGKQLDRVEPVTGNLRQLVAFEPMVVIKVRGNAKPHGLRRNDATNQKVYIGSAKFVDEFGQNTLES